MINFIKLYLKRDTVVFISIVFFTAFLSGVLFHSSVIDKYYFLNPKDMCLSNLNFINPEPGCELYEDKLDRMNILQATLETQVNGYLNSKRATRISVFTRDLTTKRFAGVNDSDTFYMASLIKLPLAIAYYRLSEITPDLLSQQLTFTNLENQYLTQNIQPKDKLTLGNTYTVKDLIYHMLAHSDNSAVELLMKNFVSKDYLQKILYSLGLQTVVSSQEEDLVTAKSYTGVIRILYNASFINRNSSNEVLKMLSDSDFTTGAVFNLPKDVIVAHKFGERTAINSNNEVMFRQLHDCGIVYAKKGKEPYTFCIMTEGQDYSNLESIIQNISKTIYEGIQK